MSNTELKQGSDSYDHKEIELHIQRARELRSEYLHAMFASLKNKVKALLHVKSHNMATSH
jgi:hypothetical protein